MSCLKKEIGMSYYAAANGFTGFHSYFDEIFSDKHLDKLHIIKGGPGTGKSTFMNKIAENYGARGLVVDRIFCSSDPASLDGIIIDKKIAVIDGTAPHEKNTKTPGAFDEIINLGENWDSQKLHKRKAEIDFLNQKKMQNYISAYKYLSFCKVLSDYIINETDKYFDKKKAESCFKSMSENFKTEENPSKEIRLFSSFSKYGYHSLLPIENATVCSLFPVDFRAYGFLNYIVSRSSDYSYYEIKSPFDPLLTEGILYGNQSFYLCISKKDDKTLDITNLFNMPEEKLNELIELTEIIKNHLSRAKIYFSYASEEHFKLEEIYKDAMDFEKNSEILEKTLCDIDKILLL